MTTPPPLPVGTGAEFMPPPPNVAKNDPILNRWLLQLTNALLSFSSSVETSLGTDQAAISALQASSRLYSGIGAPLFTLGLDGDWYGRTDSPFGVYVKAIGSWVKIA